MQKKTQVSLTAEDVEAIIQQKLKVYVDKIQKLSDKKEKQNQ